MVQVQLLEQHGVRTFLSSPQGPIQGNLHLDEQTVGRNVTTNAIEGLGNTQKTKRWDGNSCLNDTGYQHFSVIHKDQFKAIVIDGQTGERKVTSNTIRGAWKHAKDNFQRINGTQLSNFEVNLTEVQRRNHIQGQNIYTPILGLLQTGTNCSREQTFLIPAHKFEVKKNSLLKFVHHHR